jgi:hypothetical protein
MSLWLPHTTFDLAIIGGASMAAVSRVMPPAVVFRSIGAKRETLPEQRRRKVRRQSPAE